MTNALDVKGLNLSIGGDAILKNVDLVLSVGEVLGLVGRSGSGKSMTSLSVMGLLPDGAQVSGAVNVNGAAFHGEYDDKQNRRRGRDIAMIFQEPSTALNPLQTIGAQVAEIIQIHKADNTRNVDSRAAELLQRVGLSPDEISPKRFPHEISGGQRQRVMIAIAIAMKPKILIADEPTTALDVTTQAQILALLKSLVREYELAMLFITHDVAVLSQLADNVATIADGTITDLCSTQEFLKKYRIAHKNVSEKSRYDRPPPSIKEKSTTPALSVERLVCEYSSRKNIFAPMHHTRAVDNVSFSIYPGKIFGLVGESGCGKSTLARAILGLQEYQSGVVKIYGKPFPCARRSDTSFLRRHIQMVFQDPYSSFNPLWRIGDIVAEPMRLLDGNLTRTQTTDRAGELLKDVGLAQRDLDKYPHAFSGGQRQRIAIARAMATNPAILILDEATSALDSETREQILELLNSLSIIRNVGILFVSHDLSTVQTFADEILVMYEGRIIEHGSSDEIFNNPQQEYTCRLIAASPKIAQYDKA